MRQQQTLLSIKTDGQGFYDITNMVENWVQSTGFRTGLLILFIQHTSASLIIQENADPDVQYDLGSALNRLAPEDHRLYRHTIEGPDDMPAHIKTALTDVSLTIPVTDGNLSLGTWQGVYVAEHRRHGHIRRFICHLIGD